jgi:two-component system sensor histidine kinase RpfC
LEDFLATESRLPAGGARPIVALDEHSIGAVFDEAASWFLARSEDRPWPVIWLRDGSPPPQSIDALRLFTTTLGRSADAAGVAQAVLLAAATCPSEQPQDAPPARGEGLDILVAEDNKTNQMVIRKILQQAGHSVTLAENGEQAIEALGARRFDLVLMDLNMPVLNGIEAAKLARFIDLETDPVPIVALTADATEETRAKCLEAGMNDCLTKPIDRPKLLAWLEDFERQKPQHRRRASMEEPALPVETAGAHAPAGDEALDARALGDLESLGGKEFVEQIAEQFVRDAAGVLKELSQAVAQGDAQAFREHAHALRSCAANVGARKVYNLCLSWRAIDAAEVAVRGEEHVRALETEFGRARAQLGL